MELELKLLFFITEEMALLKYLNENCSILTQFMQDGLAARVNVIDETLKLLHINLIHLKSTLLKLLNQVPMEKGETLINHESIKLLIVVFIHFQVLNCE